MIFNIIKFLFLIMLVNGSLNLLSPLHRSKYSYFDPPIDFKIKIKEKRLIGNSATFGGLILSVLIGNILGHFIYNNYELGVVAGILVYIGHCIGSFIKRRLGIKEGQYLPIIDHGDYVITAGLIFFLLKKITSIEYFISIIIVLTIHPLFCLLGYKLKIRDKKL